MSAAESSLTMENRDLSFQPVENAEPRHLTRQQIADYNANGFIRPLPIYDEAEAIENRECFDRLMADVEAADDGRDSYSINGCHTLYRGIYDMATNPRTLDFVEDLVGRNIICWGTHFFCKLPGDPKKVPWHQDASYWPFTPSRTVTVWLAIDDTDEGNSAMLFIPGTHTMGHLEWKDTDDPAVLTQEIQGVEKLGEPVYDCLKAGDISLHADMLAHGSDPNHSDRRRCGLTIRYCPPEVQLVDPTWGARSIICRGEDPYKRWTPTPRPEGDDPGPAAWL
jgi:hypothetical protein